VRAKMSYTSFYFSNEANNLQGLLHFEEIFDQYFKLAVSPDLLSNLFVSESKNYKIISHTNIACKKILEDDEVDKEFLLIDPSAINNIFNWGFILFIKKDAKAFYLINDLYGIYPIYYINSEMGLIISNEFEGLINTQKKVKLNLGGLYDYFLFNYTIKSRTLISEISQLEGGSLMKFESNEFNVTKRVDITSLIFSGKDSGIEEMCKSLTDHVTRNTDPGLPVQLPLTGGFDTKVILSILLSTQQQFNAYTFGSINSDDNVAAQSIANQFGINQKFIGLTPKFINEIDFQINNYIRFSPNAPMLESFYIIYL
jgi:hypothetical protein